MSSTTAPLAIYTLSLHDALPILSPAIPRKRRVTRALSPAPDDVAFAVEHRDVEGDVRSLENLCSRVPSRLGNERSEEHTSELQSRFDLVCRLLLEKKKYNNIY